MLREIVLNLFGRHIGVLRHPARVEKLGRVELSDWLTDSVAESPSSCLVHQVLVTADCASDLTFWNSRRHGLVVKGLRPFGAHPCYIPYLALADSRSSDDPSLFSSRRPPPSSPHSIVDHAREDGSAAATRCASARHP